MIWLNDNLFSVMRKMKEEEIERILESRLAGRPEPASVSPSPSRRDARSLEAAPKQGLCGRPPAAGKAWRDAQEIRPAGV